MKHNITRLAALTAGTFLCAASAMAVPARKVPVEVTQPDGTTVMLTPQGDEFFHYLQTEDGYIVRQNDKGWYNVVGSDGNLTELPALKPESRDAAYRKSLQEIDPQASFTNLQLKSSSRMEQYRKDRMEKHRNKMQGIQKADPKWDNKDGHCLTEFPCVGKQNVLVILVNFADLKWSFCSDPHKEMQDMLQKPGYSNFDCTGSAYDYFTQSSNNIFRPSFDVYGPVDLPKKAAYYGGNDWRDNDQHPEEMVIDACDILDPEVDFSQYDRDGDGVIDNVYVFYAGNGENEGAPEWTVWPHSWDVRSAGSGTHVYDGVELGHYACSNEVIYLTNTMTGIGTFCHEFSHVLGLPDLYATSYTSAHTPGEYSLMDHGSYNNNGRTPPEYSAYERYALEWQKPYVITKNEDITMRPLTQDGNIYKMTVDPARPTEYFLFESRKQEGFDTYLPAEGMLIWHIDYKQSKWESNVANNDPGDQCIDIVEADNQATDSSMGGDTWPGSTGNTSFGADTKPAFKNKNGKKTELDITRITQLPNGMVSFRVGTGMDDDSDYALKPISGTPEEIGSDYFTVTFPKPTQVRDKGGSDGENIYISVGKYAYSEEEEAYVKEMLEGYEMKKINTSEPHKIVGVAPGTAYQINLYRYNTANISLPYEFTVLTAAEAMEETQPSVFAKEVNGNDATLNWTKIAGADGYLLTVGTEGELTAGETIETTGFTGTPRMPAGWDYSGAFSSAEGTFGESAPSFYMSETLDYLTTDEYDSEIGALSFWTSSTEPGSQLNVYGAKNGSLSLIKKLDINEEPATVKVEVPEGIRSLVLLPTATTGRIFIDDIVITGRDKAEINPVISDFAVEGDEYKVTGLDKKTTYAAYVKATAGSAVSAKSPTIRFTTSNETGVENVVSKGTAGFWVAEGVVTPMNGAERYDIYTADGMKVAAGVNGRYNLPARGLYIIRSGKTAAKVIW